MSEKDKIEQEKIGTKKKILQVAARLFAGRGPLETSILDIAQEADVNVAAINYHFHSKERLLNEVLRQIHQEMTEEILLKFSHENLSFAELCEKLFYFYCILNLWPEINIKKKS
jgi:AcrR family transcriptional regulator